MEETNYRRAFLKSPHHVWLGVATLGLGFVTGTWIGLLAGAAAYTLGWIYLPDMPFFRRWVDRRNEGARQADAVLAAEEFRRRRDSMVGRLSPRRRQQLEELVSVCGDVERAHREAHVSDHDPTHDPRLRKLDELVWTYLRLLCFEESLEQFLESERREDVPRHLREAEAEALRTERDVADLVAKGGGTNLDARQRLAASNRERAEVLRKRAHRIEQARENLAVASAELSRLVQQVKLIRADAVASRNADGLSVRIDSTVEQLGETNRWLAQIEDFRDVVGDGPPEGVRVVQGLREGAASAPVPERPRRVREKEEDA